MAVLSDDRLARSDCQLYAVLLDAADYGTVNKTLPQLAALCGVSRNTVQRSLHRLSNYGYIALQRTGRASNITIIDAILPPKKRGTAADRRRAEKEKAEMDAYIALSNRFRKEDEA